MDNLEESVDISEFDLSRQDKQRTCEALYSEAQYRFYYFKFISLSEDGNSVKFTYISDLGGVARNKETFYAHYGQLIYNMVPESYSDLQKVLAVYQYLCKNSDYTPDMNDSLSFTPYSILVNGMGICNGYANLAANVLTRMGVDAEYVGNGAHAWNLVMLDGNYYHTDVTFGAGYAGSADNELCYVLMDDAERRRSFENAGIAQSGIIIGYPGLNPESAPECTDTRYSLYNTIYYCYAFDFEHEKIYYCNDGGIMRMNTDCTQIEDFCPNRAFSMEYYNGVLYYLDYDCNLYRLVEGGSPELVDGSGRNTYLELDGAVLKYGENSSVHQSISLSKYSYDELSAKSISDKTVQMPRSQSFYIDVDFSIPMDTECNWSDYIFLFDGAGNPITAHLSWMSDGATLRIRPKDCVADFGSVSVYITEGAPAANGAPLTSSYSIKIEIVSGLSN
mgnify:CR=1 FL=1